MFGYYGSKSKIIDSYPAPKFDKIVEPFAGTAQYSLKYWDKDILLVEKYDVIAKIWQWLQKCSKDDILNIRKLEYGQHVDDFYWNCDEEKWLVGFLITGSPSQPKKSPSKWKTIMRPNTQNYKLNFIADNLHKIKHWKIVNGCYTNIENQKATWFIDPPYQKTGKYYRHSKIDYNYLSSWCLERLGETIVCEQTGANWLPFEHLCSAQGNLYRHKECVFINCRSN